jgi:hypothetical protein
VRKYEIDIMSKLPKLTQTVIGGAGIVSRQSGSLAYLQIFLKFMEYIHIKLSF